MDLKGQNRTYHEPQSAMSLLPNYYSWTYGKFLKYIYGDVVELGCGAGMGIAEYFEQAERVYAVDHDKELLGIVSRRFDSNKLEVIQTDLTSDWQELRDLRADTVVIMDVLEHFEDDSAFLEKASRLLKTNGYLVGKVPAQSALYSAMDRASGHYRRYDPDDIERLADETGLSLMFAKSMNPIAAIIYRLRNQRNSNFSRSFSVRQLRLINAAIPFLRMGDFMPFLPGLGLVFVMQKSW